MLVNNIFRRNKTLGEFLITNHYALFCSDLLLMKLKNKLSCKMRACNPLVVIPALSCQSMTKT